MIKSLVYLFSDRRSFKNMFKQHNMPKPKRAQGRGLSHLHIICQEHLSIYVMIAFNLIFLGSMENGNGK